MNVSNRLSFKALHLLSVVARHESLIEAADELNITASAVSHQIKRLEERIGFLLTYREGKTIKLSRDARAYANKLTQHFGAIEQATAAFVNVESKPIQLGVESAFAVHRLIPALSQWQDELQSLDIRVRMLNCDDKPDELGLDLVFGNQITSSHYNCQLIKQQQYFAVCTPQYKSRLISQSSVVLPENATLLEIDKVEGWQIWLSQVDSVTGANPMRYFSHTLLLLQATLSHQGVALLEESLIKQELARGDLIKLSEIPLQLPELNYAISTLDLHSNNKQLIQLTSLINKLL